MRAMAWGERMPRAPSPWPMVQRMKPVPASPDQSMPSQSKIATTGFRPRTVAWNSGVENIFAVCAGVLVRLNASFLRCEDEGPPPSPLNQHDLPNKRLMEQHLENTWLTCKTLHQLQLGAAVGMDPAAAWRRCFVKAPVFIEI